MNRKLDEIITEERRDGRVQVKSIVRHLETDNGEVEEIMSFNGDCIIEAIVLYPKDSCVDRIESKRKYRGQNPLDIRRKAAEMSINFRRNYCNQNSNSEDNEKCIFYNMISDLMSTSGKDMRKSVIKYGKDSDAYQCTLCDGHNKLCSKYAVVKK